MTAHKTGTREEWLAARLELLEAEKALTRRSDDLGGQRQELPWVRLDKEYRFQTDEGAASLADLFAGRSQLLIYHFMFGPDYTAGCPSLLGDRGRLQRLRCSPRPSRRHALCGVAGSARETAGVQAADGLELPLGVFVRQRLQLRLPGGGYQGGVGVGSRRVQLPHRTDFRPPAGQDSSGLDEFASSIVGTDWATYRREGPGVSAFALEDGVVYHTYSAYERGLDGLWGMYQWLDRAPLGRNETGFWWRRHDEYVTTPVTCGAEAD